MAVSAGYVGGDNRTAGRRRSLVGLVGLVAGLLVGTIGVGAASSQVPEKPVTRYASPHGVSTGACGRHHPCQIGRVFSTAHSGDTVIILTGRYGSASKPVPDFFIGDSLLLKIRGQAGKPAPVIFTGEGTRVDVPDDSTMSHLVIHHSGESTAFYAGIGAIADHVSVIAGPTALQACLVFGATLIDSSCFAKGPNAVAINADDFDASPSTVTLDGVDAIASGDGGVALHGQATYGSDLTLNITNSIIEGAQTDLALGASDIVDSMTANIDHSDYLTLAMDPTGGGSESVHASHDISARAKLRDVIGGDFRERLDSPTVDHGTDQSAPLTDLGDRQRRSGLRTDIGAYEFEPAPVITGLVLTARRGGIHAAIRIRSQRLTTTVRVVAFRGRHHRVSKPKHTATGAFAKRLTFTLGKLHRHSTYQVYARATSAGGGFKTKAFTVKTR
jgi:hypothetical protein